MILDRLENADRYLALHPQFAAAFEFLRRRDLRQLPLGKHELKGKQLFATIAESPGRQRGEAKLEAHRAYIDIQMVLAGVDEMGWRSRSVCKRPDGSYDLEKDAEFFADVPDSWVAVPPGSFTIFFPDDAHAPLVSTGRLLKVVVKVAV